MRINFYFAIVYLATALLFFGCQKNRLQENEHAYDRYFAVANGQPEIVKQMASKIKFQDHEKPFFAELVRKEGVPFWNNAETVTIAGETRVYIPLVLDSTEYVNSYILYREKGNLKSMTLVRGRSYASYGFAPGAASHAIAGDLIRLNHLVFGTTKFSIRDKRLFSLDKVRNLSSTYPVEYKPQASKANSEPISSSSATGSLSPITQGTDTPAPSDLGPSLECRRIVVVGTCGIHLDGGPYSCGNIYVVFLSMPCIDPPTGPLEPVGGSGSVGGGGGGGSSGLPNLNFTIAPCPVGMSQQDCDALTVPVMNYLYLKGSFSDLHDPINSPQEAPIENGIEVEDIPGFIPPGTSPRVIAHTRPRGKTEDLQFGTSGDVSGINQALVPLSDESLFANMTQLFSTCTIFDGDLRDVGSQVLNKFRNRNRDPFENSVLNEKVSRSKELVNFAKKFGEELRTKLQIAGGNIAAISSFETDYRPIFNGLHHKFHGLQILINDTEYTEIQLDDFSIDASGNWNATVTITIRDHFGLDKNDALTYQNFHDGFASWWLLQHTRAYTPFETVVKVRKSIRGRL